MTFCTCSVNCCDRSVAYCAFVRNVKSIRRSYAVHFNKHTCVCPSIRQKLIVHQNGWTQITQTTPHDSPVKVQSPCPRLHIAVAVVVNTTEANATCHIMPETAAAYRLRGLIWSLAVVDPRVGHTMDVLFPFIPVLCHSDWLFHGESWLLLTQFHSVIYLVLDDW